MLREQTLSVRTTAREQILITPFIELDGPRSTRKVTVYVNE